MKQKLLLLLLILTTVANAQFTETFSSTGCSFCQSFSFTQQGVVYNVAVSGGSAYMNDVGFGDVEARGASNIPYTVTISRADAADFMFTGIFIANTLGTTNPVTVGGYNNASLVGSSQIVGSGSETTLNFGIGAVDEVRIVTNNVNNNGYYFDDFKGNNTVTTSCTAPDIPTASSAPEIICDGNPALLTISGDKGDASAWHVYTGSCGGTLVGTTTGSTIIVTPSSPSTTYYIRGEGDCVSPGSCGTITINTTAREDASFSYDASTYCVNDSDPTPTVTGAAGGTFSSTGGLSINQSTGQIDVSASTPSTYTVTYTTPGLCNGTENVNVTINGLDDASFAYSAAFYCVNNTDPTPTITGLTGGTFSSTAGLSINASTGTIDVSASTPGTYTVTYTTSGSCPNSSNVSVTVNELDNASFSYGSASYDIGDSDPTPTITGLAGGTFSSTAGLSINASTGTIDVSASTPATYTVTYTTSGSCPNFSNTSIVVESSTVSPDSNLTLYVNKTATGNGSGSSWANAIPELADALKYAKEQDNFTTANPLKIWVAGGTYKPLYSPVDNNFGNNAARENSFLMVNNVQVYGGFAGTESTLAERDLSLTANESILSGDVNGDDNGFTNNAENNLHVVVSSGNVGNARLDGFTITGGNANTIASATINGNNFSRRNGGGIYNFTSSPSLTNLILKGNTTVDNGGGMVNINSSPTLTNVVLSGNIANNAGGMLNQNNSSPSLVNVTVSGNTAAINGGGVLNSVNSSPILTNTIIWANTGTSGEGGIFNDGSSSANISFSLVQDVDNTGNNGLDGTNTVNAPQFTDAANGDFSLTETSPAINAGSNTAYTNAGGDLANDTDLAGNPRLYDGLAATDVIDMGAYEFQGEQVINYIYEDGTWTPESPFGNATALDDITIVNGMVDFTQEVTCNNLTVNGEATLNIYDVLNLNGDLTSPGFGQIIFKSTATQDGELGELSNTSVINALILIERYMSANRAYRMVSTPSTNSAFGNSLSIEDTWQKGAPAPPTGGLDYTPGYGTHITGSTTGANGFDATASGNPSMFSLDVASQQFTAIPNTNVSLLEPAKAYLLFVRGDRSIDLTSNTSEPTETVLLSGGLGLPTGDQQQDFTTNNAGDFVMFGNPYQSAVDMSEVVANSTNVNTSQFYVYDPTLGDNGAYVTVPFSGTPIPAASEADIYLQPGQGAQIASVSAGNVSVLFQESNKAPGNHASTFRSLNNLEASINASLYTAENYYAGKKPHDGFALNFSNGYTNAITTADAIKPFNFSENLGIVSNNGTYSIEQREMPVSGEEIMLYSSGYKHNNYIFVINLENIEGVTPIFRDAFTNSEIVLENGENVLSFMIEEGVVASIAEDRFSVYFAENNLGIKEQSIFGLSLYPNPVNEESLTLKSSELQNKAVSLRLSDMLGRTLMVKEANFKGNVLKVNFGDNLTNGTYFITIANNGTKETLQFIKQ